MSLIVRLRRASVADAKFFALLRFFYNCCLQYLWKEKGLVNAIHMLLQIQACSRFPVRVNPLDAHESRWRQPEWLIVLLFGKDRIDLVFFVFGIYPGAPTEIGLMSMIGATMSALGRVVSLAVALGYGSYHFSNTSQ